MSTRRLVPIDIENIFGGSIRSTAEASQALTTIRQSRVISPGDHVVIAANPNAWVNIYPLWPSARFVGKHGPDGADLALLEVLNENVGPRFAGVTLFSGDGIFTSIMAGLPSLGLGTHVVSRPEALSRELRLAAQHVTPLPPSRRDLDAA